MTVEIDSGRTGDGLAVARSPGATADWAEEHRTDLDTLLLHHGAVLVTGAGVRSPADLSTLRERLGRRPAQSTDRFARRQDHGDGVYSWPEWAPDRDMCLHHEQSHGVRLPGLLLMGCLATPAYGGAMLVGDTRAVLGHLPERLATRFESTGWTLRRNFRPYLGLSWSEAFATADPEELRQRCADDLVGCSWSKDGTLRTAQRRATVVTHPVTGERCWFNDVAFFNQWSVAPAERGVLLSAFGPLGIPSNTLFGDGDPLTGEDYDAIMGAYEAATVRVEWAVGDLLLLDNVLTAHGREPYQGRWEVAVALADPMALSRCAPSPPPSIVEP
jgi:alpha-ketoglutarate-dependent taurine dioxygenase